MNERGRVSGVAGPRRGLTIAVALIAIAWCVQAAAQQRSRENLPASVSLYPEYVRYGLTAQAQQGDTCWDYSILGCLELELSRARKTTVSLSGPYLAWAADRADRDAVDKQGSNFGRAGRALERFGVCERALGLEVTEKHPDASTASEDAIQNGTQLLRGVHIDYLRFWKAPPGLTEEEMTAVKSRLAAGHPVAVGMRWPKKLTVEDASLCLLGTCRSLDETMDGHCITLVGYEDDPRYPGGGAFTIRNTWGPNWMSEGYGRMSYTYLRQFANDAISFAVDPDAPNGLAPNRTPQHNTTDQPVLDLKAAQLEPDPGLPITDDEMGRFKRGVWQADNQVFCKAAGPNVGFTLDVSVPETGRYRLSIAATKAPDYGIWRALLDGKPVGTGIDCCWPNVEPSGEMQLGFASLAAGKHTLRLECAGKATASKGYFFGVDWIRLQLMQ